jgi:hypothetical protein
VHSVEFSGDLVAWWPDGLISIYWIMKEWSESALVMSCWLGGLIPQWWGLTYWYIRYHINGNIKMCGESDTSVANDVSTP